MQGAKTVISLIAAGLFSAAIAQDEARVEIEVTTDDLDGANTHIVINGDQLGVNLHDMQEGENQAIVDEHGRTILITREADGFRFDVDGRSIKMPPIAADHETMMGISAGHAENVEVHVEHGVIEVDGDDTGERTVTIVRKVEVVTD
jgi:hypothetical protein